MFVLDDMLLMAALGAGGGALFNKKDPLKGALIGAGLGAGGAALPGLLGGGAAAGGATAGIAPGATAATEAGLLGAETGINSMGYLAPEMSGIAAEQAAAPVANMSTQAGMFDKLNYQTGGLLGQGTDAYSKYSKPVGAAMKGASMAQDMAGQNQPLPPPPPIVPPTASPALSQIASGNYQNMLAQQEQERKRREMHRMRIKRMGGY